MNTNLIRNHYHSQGDWFGASVYDYIHPEDQEKVRPSCHHLSLMTIMRMTMMTQGEEYDGDNGVQVREQLSTSDNQSNGRILDLKTGTVGIHRKHHEHDDAQNLEDD